jgi:predicted PurR-regulated permease PerM
MSAYQTFRNTVVVVLTLAGVYVAYLSSHILIVLLIAIITASAIRPAVVQLNKWHAPTGLGILLAYLALGLGILGLAVVVVPPVTSQLAQYMNNDQSLANQIISAQSWVEQTIQSYTGNPIKLFNPDDIRKTVSTTIEQVIVAFPAIAGTFGALVGDLVLVIVIGVYWLTKRDRTIDFVLQLMPFDQRASAGEIVREIELAMGSYLRGIVLVACFVGTANFLILSLLRVPNAVTLGFIGGVTTAVPLVGG